MNYLRTIDAQALNNLNQLVMSRIERIKQAMKQGMIDFNNGKPFRLHYTQEEIGAIDNLSDDFVLMRGRLLGIR